MSLVDQDLVDELQQLLTRYSTAGGMPANRIHPCPTLLTASTASVLSGHAGPFDMSTIYEAMGGADAVLALAEAWHARCLADPILSHPFEGEIHPRHTERLAAYWAEQLGGPTDYTESMGDYSLVTRLHSGNGPHEQMDGRGIAAFVLALEDAGIPDDQDLRFNLVAWFGWATARLNHHWPTPEDVPASLPLPRWNWDGTDGW